MWIFNNMRNFLTTIVLLFLASCITSKKPDKTHPNQEPSEEISDTSHLERNLVFDVSGSFQGDGDIIGPISTMLELKKLHPQDRFTIIYDDRSFGIIKGQFQGTKSDSLDDVGERLGVTFIKQGNTSVEAKADYLFQLFYGFRTIADFRKNDYVNGTAVTLISNAMHGTELDEILDGESHIFFKPLGIGKERSGVVKGQNVSLFEGLDTPQRMVKAAEFFEDTTVKQILTREVYSDLGLGFFYGIHNEKKEASLIGQTANYIENIRKHAASTHPTILFTPHKKADLQEVGIGVGGDHSKISTLEEFKKLGRLENEVYVISLGRISGTQFDALMVASDLPVLVEGDNSALP
jgi:hypothetical protein